jgi:hypothetical protein
VTSFEVVFFEEPPDLALEVLSPESVPAPEGMSFFVTSISCVRFEERGIIEPWHRLFVRSPVARVSVSWSFEKRDRPRIEELAAKVAPRLPGVHLVTSGAPNDFARDPDFKYQENAFELIDRNKLASHLLGEYPEARDLLRAARTMRSDDRAKLVAYLLQLFNEAATLEHKLIIADAFVTLRWREALPRLEREGLFSLDAAIEALRRL